MADIYELMDELGKESLELMDFVTELHKQKNNISAACRETNHSRVWWYSKSEETREKLMEMAKELHRVPLQEAMFTAQENANAAVDVLVELMQIPQRSYNANKLRLDAAKEILKLVGAYAPEKLNASVEEKSEHEVEIVVRYEKEKQKDD